jgi:hypothetical protein
VDGRVGIKSEIESFSHAAPNGWGCARYPRSPGRGVSGCHLSRQCWHMAAGSRRSQAPQEWQ